MQACGQLVDKRAWAQAQLYLDLVQEEHVELIAELLDGDDEFRRFSEIDPAKVAKEGIDLIYVVLGLLHSLGIDSVRAFDLVQQSNAAKVDPETGQVRRREDGKILKPDGWQAPDMSAVV
jgi:predicted HAD superfamily Cof-like phosphohydrolase